MAINEHPMTQVPCQIYRFLPHQRLLLREAFPCLNVNCDKLIASFRDHLRVVYSDVLVPLNHFFVQDESLLYV